MPQASDWLRQKMVLQFPTNCDGSPVESIVDASLPLAFLESRGYVESPTNLGYLRAPARYKHMSDIPEDEWLCILYLVHEWDFALDESTFVKDRANDPLEDSSSRDDQESVSNDPQGPEEDSGLASDARKTLGDPRG